MINCIKTKPTPALDLWCWYPRSTKTSKTTPDWSRISWSVRECWVGWSTHRAGWKGWRTKPSQRVSSLFWTGNSWRGRFFCGGRWEGDWLEGSRRWRCFSSSRFYRTTVSKGRGAWRWCLRRCACRTSRSWPLGNGWGNDRGRTYLSPTLINSKLTPQSPQLIY